MNTEEGKIDKLYKTPIKMAKVYYTDCCGCYSYSNDLDNIPTCSSCGAATTLVLDELPVYIEAKDIYEFLEKLGFENE